MHMLSGEQRKELHQCFINSQTAIKSILKQYRYSESLSHKENMAKLHACLGSIIEAEGMEDFFSYLSDPEQLPIQISFKSLRYDNLVQLLQDWLANKEKEEYHEDEIQHNLTGRFRNIIFKQIMLEEKESISDYFETLSEKKRLKGVDLYQLLSTILSSYYLYEFATDSTTFFEKTNSFERFLAMVDEFISNSRRIIVKDTTNADDEKYIRLYELESLLEFWEYSNTQLTLTHEPRKNMYEIAIQTIIVNSTETATQADRIQNQTLTYLNTINTTIHELNRLIQIEANPQILESINRVFDVLRREKIVAVHADRGEIDSNKAQQNLFVSFGAHESKTPPKLKEIRVGNEKSKSQGLIERIFLFLEKQSEEGSLSVNQLQIFFYQMGLVKAHENFLITNLLDKNFIEDPDSISMDQFKRIVKQIMVQSERITTTGLKSYMEKFKVGKSAENKVKTNKQLSIGFRSDRKSHYGLLEKQGLSKTTYHLDSDES